MASFKIHKLILHHLQLSQSERIVWLLEEMGQPYQLRLHQRIETGLGPQSIKELHPAGTAPLLEHIIEDAEDKSKSQRIIISETEAIVDYILSYEGHNKRLTVPPGSGDDFGSFERYANYLEWLRFANGTLQPAFSRKMSADRVLAKLATYGPEAKKESEEGMIVKYNQNKAATVLGMLDTQLGKTKFLAGDQVTLADIMTVFTLTTMRGFVFMDLTNFKNILRYLKDISNHKEYQAAMKKGDPDLKPMIEPVYDHGFIFGMGPFFDVRK